MAAHCPLGTLTAVEVSEGHQVGSVCSAQVQRLVTGISLRGLGWCPAQVQPEAWVVWCCLGVEGRNGEGLRQLVSQMQIPV